MESKHFKALDLTEDHDLDVESKKQFLEAQVGESKKIIYRHIVELEVADAMAKRAAKEKDPELKMRLNNLVGQRQLEGKESIKQIRVNVDTALRMLSELDQ